MDNPTYMKVCTGTTGTLGTGGQVNHVTLRRNDVIELLKTMEGLKKQLMPLLK